MGDRTPISSGARRRRSSGLHTPLSAEPKISKGSSPRVSRTTPRRRLISPGRNQVNATLTEPRQQRLVSPQKFKAPLSNKRACMTPSRRTPTSPALKGDSTPKQSLRSAHTVPSTIADEYSQDGNYSHQDLESSPMSEAWNDAYGSGSQDSGGKFGFQPGAHDTMAFEVPSFFDDVAQNRSSKSDSFIQENSVTPPNHLADTTEAIMGFPDPANNNPPQASFDFPTEVIFTSNLLLGVPLSPVQEEDPPPTCGVTVAAPSAKTSSILAEGTADCPYTRDKEFGDVMEEDVLTASDQQAGARDGDQMLETASEALPSTNRKDLVGSHVAGSPTGSFQRLADGQSMDHDLQGHDPGQGCETSGNPKDLPVALSMRKVSTSPHASQYQSPAKSQGSRGRRSMSLSSAAREPTWMDDMHSYLDANKRPELDASHSSLVEALQTNCTSSENWWKFLRHEEAIHQGSPAVYKKRTEGAFEPRSITLFNMYQWALELVPEGPGDYVSIWIGYCRQLWLREPEEAVTMLKCGVKSRFGKESVELLSEAIQCLCSLGEKDNALRTVDIKLRWARRQSEPLQDLEKIASDIELGRVPPYKPQCNVYGMV